MLLAVDTETTGLHPYGRFKDWGFYPARPFAVSACDKDGNTRYWRWEVDPFTRKVNYKSDLPAFREVRDIMADETIVKLFHNADFDLRQLKHAGMPVKGRVEDTKILAHACTGGKEMTYSLKPLCKKYFDFSDEDQKELILSVHRARREGKKKGWCIAEKHHHGKQPAMADYWMGDPELCKRYAIQDVERTMLLLLFLREKAHEEPDYWNTYRREMKLLPVILKMEERGVRVFPEEIARLQKFYREYRDKYYAVLRDDFGLTDYKPRSYKQNTDLFIKKYGLATLGLTKKGRPQLNGEFFQHYAETPPPGTPPEAQKLARTVLEIVNADQALGSFLYPYARLAIPEKGGSFVLHPSYNQTGAVTGRISCTEPNLMNVASETTGRKRSQIALRPRECFGPRRGHMWYLPDYSQIEVWLFAYLSGSQTMLNTLMSGHDFHSTIAHKVWSKEPDFEERKSYWRKRAKLVMFCKLYGGGKKKVAKLLQCTVPEAERFVNQYDAELPDVQRFIHRIQSRAAREGGVVNPFGRHYYVDPGFEYRMVNYLVQGTAAEIMKLGMIATDEYLALNWPKAYILMTVHDELIIELPIEYHCPEMMRGIISAMESPSDYLEGLPKRLPVSMKIATRRWAKTKEVDLVAA